jgi:hypothetical protein
VKSGTSLCINILSAGISYSKSACQKQLPVTFGTPVCPQSCTQRVRFCQDLSESTPRVFLVLLAQHSKPESPKLLAHSHQIRWTKTAVHSLPNLRLPSILHSEGPFLPGPQRNHTARFFGCSSRNTQNNKLKWKRLERLMGQI